MIKSKEEMSVSSVGHIGTSILCIFLVKQYLGWENFNQDIHWQMTNIYHFIRGQLASILRNYHGYITIGVDIDGNLKNCGNLL